MTVILDPASPALEARKWDQWLRLQATGVQHDVFPEKKTGNSIERQCVRGKKKGELHRWKHGETTEWEIEWAGKSDIPTEAWVDFACDLAPGLEAHKQLPLSPAEIDAGSERPEHVVNSYAIYGRETGGAYETGKFAHIDRPVLIDARGERRWLDQTIEAGRLRVLLDLDWMAQAKYPVILDPTIGHSSVGATTINIGPNYIEAFGPFTSSEEGEVISLSFYLQALPRPQTLGFYANSSGAPGGLLGNTADFTGVAGQWNTVNLSTPIPVAASTDYFLASAHSTNTLQGKADSYTPSRYRYAARAYTAGVMPNPFPTPTASTNYRFSFYATAVPLSRPEALLGLIF